MILRRTGPGPRALRRAAGRRRDRPTANVGDLAHRPLPCQPAATRDFLSARLRDLEREIFCCPYLDKRHRLYGVETRLLNQAVKRNAERFPDDFRFQLTAVETAASKSQSVTLKPSRGQNVKFLPYAFTEHGAIMAATVLNSPRAVEMSVYVVRAFVQLRELISSNKELVRRLDQLEARIEKKLATHDDAIAAMLSAIRQLMNPPRPTRRGIGFTANIETEK